MQWGGRQGDGRGVTGHHYLCPVWSFSGDYFPTRTKSEHMGYKTAGLYNILC